MAHFLFSFDYYLRDSGSELPSGVSARVCGGIITSALNSVIKLLILSQFFESSDSSPENNRFL
jgi:hypothetical protein